MVGLPVVTVSPDAVGLPWVVGLPGAEGVPVEPGHLVRYCWSVGVEPCAGLACVLILGLEYHGQPPV